MEQNRYTHFSVLLGRELIGAPVAGYDAFYKGINRSARSIFLNDPSVVGVARSASLLAADDCVEL
jgi:hypothetical protein